MTKFIKSSVKTNPDPIYYRNKLNYLIPKRNRLLDHACALEEAAGAPEQVNAGGVETPASKRYRRAADKLTDKIRWYINQHKVSLTMKEDAAWFAARSEK